MFNTQKLIKAVSNLGGKVANETSKYMPAMMSEEKRFSNSYAACLSLLVCADLEVEEDETIAALGFIQNDRSLIDRNLVLSSLGYYGKFIEELSITFSNKPSYLLKKAKLIQEHVSVNLSPEHKQDLMRMCNLLVGVNANQQEKEVYNEIENALR